ncbi:ABC transporter ATP-binding protein/permease [Kineosporia rhizophila]|uniref:ABC transporter ATP-binding protein n=1 Tax=Kineosporia rhizophila TaxID=84633 RepID=UPI001E4EDC19|nr:ABC transporter ATP-binding protein [Kineosporia rhizophila]MCE0537827.1 ABC transporter ATP-binding protein/permease [Kineosporia rhizophila]
MRPRERGPETGSQATESEGETLGPGPENDEFPVTEGQTSFTFRDTLALASSSLKLVWAAGRRELVVILVMDALQAIALFFVIFQLQRLITELILADRNGDSSALAMSIGLFVLVNMVAIAAQTVISNRRPLLSERTGMYVSGEVIRVAGTAELADFDDSAFHDRLQRAAASAATRPSMLVQSLVMILQETIALLAIWIALAFVAPVVAAALLVVVVPIWIAGVRGGEEFFGFITRITHTDRGRNYLFGLLTQREPAKEIRALDIGDYLTQRWRVSMNRRIDLLAETMRKRMRASVLGSLGSNVVMAIAGSALVAMNQAGYLTLPETATVAGALLMFSQRLLRSVTMANDFFESAPLVRDLNEFLALEPSLVRVRSGQAYAGQFDQIEIDGASFRYFGSGKDALEAVSLSIRAGEVVALVGENGSGKTTLAKMLAGLYAPTSGQIRVDGVDLAAMDTATWRARVAVLFQDFIRYALPAGENIHVGDVSREPLVADIREAARAAGADGFLASLPDGYRTILSPQFSRGQDLSLGQWQRVALARAFFRDAPLVILDEPTASLDARAERALFDSIRDLYVDRTVLLISHRFATVRSADRIVVLKDGRIVEHGSHTDLMASNGLYAELFSIQAAGFLDADEQEEPDEFTAAAAAAAPAPVGGPVGGGVLTAGAGPAGGPWAVEAGGPRMAAAGGARPGGAGGAGPVEAGGPWPVEPGGARLGEPGGPRRRERRGGAGELG